MLKGFGMKNNNGSTSTTGGSSAFEDKLDSITDSVKGLEDTGSEKAEALKTKVVDLKDEAFSRGNALLDGATDYIQENPFKAVGIAFGVGYFAMRIFRR